MKSLLIISALLQSAAFSQETATQPANVTKVVRIRYGLPDKIAQLLIPGTPVTVTADNYSKVVVLKGDPSRVAALEQTIHEIDVPGAGPVTYKSKNVELVISVICGSNRTETSPEGQAPEAMTSVIKQLRTAFPYKNYQLLNSMLLRSSEGAKAGSRGTLADFENHSRPSEYTVEYGEAKVSTEGGKSSVHLRNFIFATSIPVSVGSLPNTTQFQTVPVTIGTDLDLGEGQKIVVGKADIGNSGLALFVVLTARLVD